MSELDDDRRSFLLKNLSAVLERSRSSGEQHRGADSGNIDEDRLLARLEAQIAQARDEAADLIRTLSPRETHVLALMTRGYSNKAIARQLEISPRTVEVHRANMLAKINARSSADAVRVGVYAGLDLLE